MRLYKVNEDDLGWLAEQPESAMGLQLVWPPDRIVQVVGGQVIFEPEANGNDAVPLEFWMTAGNAREREAQFREWLSTLPHYETPLSEGRIVNARFVIVPAGPFLAPPVPGIVTYGHLPYLGTCSDGEVYYR